MVKVFNNIYMEWVYEYIMVNTVGQLSPTRNGYGGPAAQNRGT